VAALPDGALVVSASHAGSMAMALVRMAFGLPLGDALEWSADGGWRHVRGTQVGLPNGIAVRGDDRLFLADWSGGRLVRIDRTTGQRDEVALPHHPDNLSWTADGRLLVAGQLGSVRIAVACLDGTIRNCGQPWSVLAVDPDTLAVTTVAEGDGLEFGAASSAVLVGDTLVVGTWAGDRVLRARTRR
jgi:sugar lactone lactonase YvrE